MIQLDAPTVVGVVAIINAAAAAIALIVTTWFAARRAGRMPHDLERRSTDPPATDTSEMRVEHNR